MADTFAQVGMADQKSSLEGFIYDPNPQQDLGKLRSIIALVSIFAIASLLVTIGLYIGRIRLKKEIELRKVAEEEARRLAYNDSLTGIPNRNTFIPYASKQLLSAHRTGQKIALLYIDLNDFKTINDNYGHKAGDIALIHTATALTSAIRESDMAARVGGDEFVVLLTGIQGIDTTKLTLERIHQALALPVVFNKHDLFVSASIGVSFYPDDGDTIDILISKADHAMFAEKAISKSSATPKQPT